ncbi:MAG: glycosyltransferase family 4 protein [Planctomycetota bacterium]|jgi:UDP-GlcNAc:undecaprenyl-phosphate GlcNAc-1-phosphate transferase
MSGAASYPHEASSIGEAVDALTTELEPVVVSAMDLLNSYAVIFVAAFLVTLLCTPLVRRLALAGNVTDDPDSSRKVHPYPVAYLGGVAVFLGLIAALAISYVYWDGVAANYRSVPIAIVLGMAAIMFTGLADDVWGLGPRLKIAGQLIAAALLAVYDIGVRVAAGVLKPVALWLDPLLGCENLVFQIPVPGVGDVPVDLIYWAGTAVIAIFVLGGCNAANLVDGLDGLLSGVVAFVALGLLAICVLMALPGASPAAGGPDTLAGARIVLCLALLGAVLGFLPHNFNPASIFLGDCGSLLLGYVCVVIILMLGEYGQTHLVFAGLIVFSVPIMDTTLAIIRRWLAGTPMSAADDQHMHHQLRRALGGVKRAVIAIYGVGVAFAIVGVTLAALVMRTELRVRVVYAIALVLFGFIGVIAVKTARRQRQLAAQPEPRAAPPAAASRPPRPAPAPPPAGPSPVKPGSLRR